MRFHNVAINLLALIRLTQSVSLPHFERDVISPPPPPDFVYFYTAFADCLNPYISGDGPSGVRTYYPVTGGNFSGPVFHGTLLNGGGDWGAIDPKTMMFTADSRYTMISSDGVIFYVRTSGPQIGGGNGPVHVRLMLETGDKNWYWVNNAIIIGIAQPMDSTDIGFTLRLDIYHLAIDRTYTNFSDNTTYGLETANVSSKVRL